MNEDKMILELATVVVDVSAEDITRLSIDCHIELDCES